MRKHFFYPRLALINLRKNKIIYLPYLLVCSLSIVMFYCLCSLLYNPDLSSMPRTAALEMIFQMGVYILGLFSCVLYFYTNSFLMKRRQKEFALYNILGMEKKHIAKVLFYENIITTFVSLTTGLLFGILISRVIFLIFVKVTHLDIPLGFHISGTGVSTTIVTFSLIFILILIRNLIRIHIHNPISLLQSSQSGEREPKASIILTILGILSLGFGYYTAIVTENPLEALYKFFFAVLGVILGTYFLFISGSIAVLKRLKKSQRFYYKPKNFVAVSGMLYRMKQNAAGLASICILCTMTLVTISTTITLYQSGKHIARAQCSDDVMIYHSSDQTENIHSILSEDQDFKIQKTDMKSYLYSTIYLLRDGDHFRYLTDADMENIFTLTDFTRQTMFTIITLDDYNRIENSSAVLADHEILMFDQNSKTKEKRELQINSRTFSIKENLNTLKIASEVTNSLFSEFYIVVSDMETLTQIVNEDGAVFTGVIEMLTTFNLSGGTDEEKLSYSEQLQEKFPMGVHSRYIECFYLVANDNYIFFGGFLFIGIFLGIIFLGAATLIIYYKQISEGYQDHDRFLIMQKVGMSKIEVRKTINKQILMVFFLPLLTAVIHLAFSLKVIGRLLILFGIVNFNLIIYYSIATILVFIILYMLIYKLTARSYLKLVAG